MKQRILFVDDEPSVLNALRRTLWTLNAEWEMTFAESGARALDLMAQQPFDVVVSDMMMPGMNGAQLLNEVMRRHPQTIRLILSGHADRDLILQCVGSTHQYLSKPCDAAVLQATLRRVVAVEASLESGAIKRLVTRLEYLPSIPALYGELVALLQAPETPVEEVAGIVERDPAMTAKVLKLVNSAFFGLARQVTSLPDACGYLGLDTLRSLVLSLQTFSQFQARKLGGIELESLWRHSLRTAQAAKRIARRQAAAVEIVDAAFVAGLLHDVGKLILAANCVAEYERALRQAREKPEDLVEAEKAVFGCDHADVGGYLMGLWGLPTPVVEAIALHHAPGRSHSEQFDPLTAVHAANALVQERDGPTHSILSRGLDLQHFQKLGLAHRIEVWRQEVTSAL